MEKKLDCTSKFGYDNEIYRQDGRTDSPVIVGHNDILRKTQYSRDNVMNFLRRNNLIFSNGEVVWCVRPDGFLFKDYSLILFGKGGVRVILDYTQQPKHYVASYDKINIAITDNSDNGGIYQFNIGGYQNKGKAICLALREIKQRKDKYTPTKRWSDNLVDELQHNIDNYCYRPFAFF